MNQKSSSSRASLRARSLQNALESLEDRKLFTLLGLGAGLATPILGIDGTPETQYVASYDASSHVLDIKAQAFTVETDSSFDLLDPIADVEIRIKVGTDGSLIGGVDGVDDLLITQDADGPGDAPATTLLKGEIRLANGFGYDASSGKLEAIFAAGAGTDLYNAFVNGTTNNDIGVRLTLGDSGLSFGASFSDLVPKGDLGGWLAPPPPVMASKSSIAGYVYSDCGNDGVKGPSDTGIGGVNVALLRGTTVVATTLTDANGLYTFINLDDGTYTVVENFNPAAGYIDGLETVGTGATAGSIAGNDKFSVTVAGGQNAINYNFAEVKSSSLGGFVWADFNDDGLIDFNEQGIGGVTVYLYKLQGSTYVKIATTATDSAGHYQFDQLLPGTYKVVEVQPCSGFDDASESLGYVNGVHSGTVGCDLFSGIVLTCGSTGTNYNFGEQPNTGCGIRCGDTGTVCFYASNSGRNLIYALNGGQSGTQLGNWLAATLPNIYGATSGGKNLAGKTNKQVYDTFVSKVNSTSARLDAQVMALAFSVYVTSSLLAGNVAASYGFRVSTYGVGTRSVSTSGCCGCGCNNNSTEVLDILFATDAAAVNGNLYNGNSSARNTALTLYTRINEEGDSH